MTLPEVESPARQDARWPLEVVTARRPLRWLGAACVLVVLGMVASALVTNPAWEWPVVGQYLFAPSVVPFGPVFFDFGTMDLIGPLTVAVLGLALHQAAYAAEIVRGGLLSVDHGQREAAAALGLPPARRLFRIILPQAMRTIVPTAFLSKVL